MSKGYEEIASDIVIAWINAKTATTVADAGGNSDRGIPTATEAAEYYKTIYEAIKPRK